MRRIMLGTLIGLSLLATACGDDDDDAADPSEENESGGSGGSGSREDYVAAVGDMLGVMGLPADQTECAAGVFVDTVGLEQLQDAASPDEIRNDPSSSPAELGDGLDQADHDSFYSGLNECFDVREFFVNTLSGGDPAIGTCLGERIDEELLKQIMVTGLLDAEAAAAGAFDTAMNDVYAECAPTTPTSAP